MRIAPCLSEINNLAGVDYPASKDDLLNAARSTRAPERAMDILEQMPGDRFQGAPGVMKAYGQVK
jgi:hypothetical protein